LQKLLVNGVNFGERLKQLREKSGLSQYDVEIKLALHGRPISRSQYANIEQGKGNIFIKDLILLKNIFNVEYSEFFIDLAE
jgi:transcriptional regulator with XRE-family HTH domain